MIFILFHKFSNKACLQINPHLFVSTTSCVQNTGNSTGRDFKIRSRPQKKRQKAALGKQWRYLCELNNQSLLLWALLVWVLKAQTFIPSSMKTNSTLTLAALLCLGLGSVESFSRRSCSANLSFTLGLSHSQSQSSDMNNCTKGYGSWSRENIQINKQLAAS